MLMISFDDIINMKIKYIKAKNFLSYRNPVEVNFTTLGNIIYLKGVNGAGKSSILEIIVYGLYGKLIKKLTHKEAINNKIKKGLEVEIHWDDYRVVRRRKPDELLFFHKEEELTLGGMPATQDLIEQTIGLNYHAFINVALFGQHNQYAFLSCDPATKRQIVENLLSLDRYNKYCQVAKDKRKSLEQSIVLLVKEYEIVHRSIDSLGKRIDQIRTQQSNWWASHKKTVLALQEQYESKQQLLSGSERGQAVIRFHEAQEELKRVKDSIAVMQSAIDKIDAAVPDAQQKKLQWDEKKTSFMMEHNSLLKEVELIDSQSEDLERELSRLNGMQDGTECPLCHNKVSQSNCANVKLHIKNKLDHFTSEIKKKTKELERLKLEAEKAKNASAKVQEALELTRDKRRQIKLKLESLNNKQKELEAVPNFADNQEQFIQEQLVQLKRQMESKGTEVDPYKEILDQTVAELSEVESKAAALKDDIKEKERLLPYYEFWIKGFGDQGIRKFVIDEIVPSLNSRVNYWLQFLIDNKIKIEFNNQLEETISANPPDGDPFVYHGLSGGEHCRIDLAISQAFSHLMMLSSGTCPSIVALDEVASFQDRDGVQCVYTMICELSRDRQVIVITHDPDLQELLQSADVIEVERVDGTSRIK
jgi:DNA repair exonuclease SbcCD ATPase subunit